MGVSSIFDQWILLCRGLLLFFSFNLLGVSRHPHFHTFYTTEVIDSLIINHRFKGMACRKWFITLHTWKSHCGKTSILQEVQTHHVSMQARCQKNTPIEPMPMGANHERGMNEWAAILTHGLSKRKFNAKNWRRIPLPAAAWRGGKRKLRRC